MNIKFIYFILFLVFGSYLISVGNLVISEKEEVRRPSGEVRRIW